MTPYLLNILIEIFELNKFRPKISKEKYPIINIFIIGYFINCDNFKTRKYSLKIDYLIHYINFILFFSINNNNMEDKYTTNIYQLVSYNDKKYYVFKYAKNDGTSKLFIIDEEDFEKVVSSGFSIYKMGEYVGFIANKKTYYVHNLVMDKVQGGGKGQQYTVDHINRITHDNRKANLRIISQSEQNMNQNKRERIVKLPKNCGVSIDKLPKCVWYRSADKTHGDRFILELKGGDKHLRWQTSTSKLISTYDKFVEIIEIILKLNKVHPEYFAGRNVVENYTDHALQLIKEYNKIISRTNFNCIKNNLVEIPKKIILESLAHTASDKMKKYLETLDPLSKTGKNHQNKIPPESGITPNMIPKYCGYRPAKGHSGDYFEIDRHPQINDNNRGQWRTSTSKYISLKVKFDQLMEKLEEIKDNPIVPKNPTKKTSTVKKSGNGKITGGSEKTNKITKELFSHKKYGSKTSRSVHSSIKSTIKPKLKSNKFISKDI